MGYPELWSQPHDSQGLANPRWAALHAAWSSLSQSWDAAISDVSSVEDAKTARQVAALQMLRPIPSDASSSLTTPPMKNKTHSRPVAIELSEILASLGQSAHGPVQEGPVEFHAVSE